MQGGRCLDVPTFPAAACFLPYHGSVTLSGAKRLVTSTRAVAKVATDVQAGGQYQVSSTGLLAHMGGIGIPHIALTAAEEGNGSARKDSETSVRRRPGLGDVILVLQARVKSRAPRVNSSGSVRAT